MGAGECAGHIKQIEICYFFVSLMEKPTGFLLLNAAVTLPIFLNAI